MPEPLLSATALTKVFWTPAGAVRAVNKVDLAIPAGETLGLVGESGSGKSTLGRLLLRLIEPTSGQVRFEGVDLVGLNGRALRQLRPLLQIVFQNPYGSLLPHLSAAANVAEPMRIHGSGDRREQRLRALDLLDRVGISGRHADLYPRQFSGGQQQRIAIARALALKPRLIVYDEPTSALDASIQAQILNLIQEIQRDLGVSYLFISHNLAVVERLSARVAVMYRGEIVEEAPSESLFSRPRHPYTLTLMNAIVSARRQPEGRSPAVAEAWGEAEPTELAEVAPGHRVRMSAGA